MDGFNSTNSSELTSIRDGAALLSPLARRVQCSRPRFIISGMLMILMMMVMVFITMIFQLYTELPSGNLSPGSEICGCQEGGQLKCTTLEEVIVMMTNDH